MAADPHPKRGRPRDPRRDAAILEAALELVAECGYDRMTIAELALRAGVSKPTIYLRFPGGKQEVLAAAMTAKRDVVEADDADTGSLRDDLVALIRSHIANLHRDVHLAAGIIPQLRESPELAEVFRSTALRRERERVRTILDRAEARGELAGAGATTELFASVGPSLIFTRVLMTGEPVDDAFVDDLVDNVLLPILPIEPE